mmetsp:Transcript_78476/g.155464  ORF Transcript_78476/g.155464 Transcript_78476/m.155464 type:complete len:200 (-) Transcript_78476:489-1088(-)
MPLSKLLGRIALMAERHLRPHRQALQPVLGWVSIAWRRFLLSARSWLLPLLKTWAGSSLVVQRDSHARSRCRFAAFSTSRPRSNLARPLSLPSGLHRRRCPSTLRLFSSRRRRLRLRLLRHSRLRLRGAFSGGHGSLLLSHVRCWTASRKSRQSPSSGNVCIMAGQLPRTQSLNRFASTIAARLSKQRNCARCRFGAQS